jgi:hypothetical protein
MFSRKLIYSSECVHCGYRREKAEKKLMHRCPKCNKPYLEQNIKVHNLRKRVLFNVAQKKEWAYKLIICILLVGAAIYTGAVSNSGRLSSEESDPVLYWLTISMYSTIGLSALYIVIRNWLRVKRLKKELGNAPEIEQ